MDIVTRLRLFLSQQDIAITQFADNCGISRPTLSQLLNGRNKKVSDDLIRKIHHAYPTLSVMWLMFGEGNMYMGLNSASSANAASQSSPNSSQSEDKNDVDNSFESDRQLSFDYIESVADDNSISKSDETYSDHSVRDVYDDKVNRDDILLDDVVDDSDADGLSLSTSSLAASAVSIDFGHGQGDDGSGRDDNESQLELDSDGDRDMSAESIGGDGDVTSDDANAFIAEAHQKSTVERKIVNIIVYYDDNSFESFGPLR